MKTLTKEQYEFLLTIKDCVGGCDDNTDYDDGEIQSAMELGKLAKENDHEQHCE